MAFFDFETETEIHPDLASTKRGFAYRLESAKTEGTIEKRLAEVTDMPGEGTT